MQGRLIGKRFQAKFFLESGYEETHGCNYLLPPTRYGAGARLQGGELVPGYGDFVMKPDLSTLRNVPWLEKTALVLCDIRPSHHDDLSIRRAPY